MSYWGIMFIVELPCSILVR